MLDNSTVSNANNNTHQQLDSSEYHRTNVSSQERMLNSGDNNPAAQLAEFKQCKKNLQKTSAKYQQLIKEHSSLQHEYQMREVQMQRLTKEMSELREDISSKDNKMKQLRYENDRLFTECSNLKNLQAMMGMPVSQITSQQ